MFEKKLNATLSVDGMHCNHCKAKVENAIKSVKGVKSVTVSLDTATAEIVYAEGKTTPEAVAEAISAIGFNAKVK
jgi:copper chaperone CopZ